MMKRILLLGVGLLWFTSLFGQKHFISGTVSDAEGQGVTVFDVLLLRADSSMLAGESFMDGRFVFRLPAEKPAFIKIRALGYEDTVQDFEPTDRWKQQADTLLTGQWVMTEQRMQLGEVVVMGSRSPIRQKGTAYEVLVAGSYLRHAGTFLDLVQRIPGMVADAGGGIAVMGKPRLLCYLNGRLLSDMSELLSLRSDQVKSIEIDRNPGAEHSASCDAIVHITTVNVAQDYMQLTATGNLSQSRKTLFNGSLLFNGKSNSLQYSMDLRLAKSGVKQYDREERKIETDSDELHTLRTSTIDGNGRQFYIKPMVEYVMPRSRIALSYRFFWYDMGDVKWQDMEMSGSHSGWVGGRTDTHAKTVFHNPTLYARHQWGHHSLELTADYMTNEQNSRQLVEEVPARHIEQQFSNRYDIAGAALDYVWRSDWAKWQLGARGSYLHDAGLSEAMGATGTDNVQTEKTWAGYGSMLKTIGRFTFGAGLRIEWKDARSDSQGHHLLDTTYLNCFPNLSAAYSGKDCQLGFSYTKRISRPGLSQLSIRENYIDPLSYFVGNPLLQSNITDVYSLAWQSGALSLSLSYNRHRNLKAQVAHMDAGTPRRIKFTYDNVPLSHELKTMLMYNYKWGNFRGNVTAVLTNARLEYEGLTYARFKDMNLLLKSNMEVPLWKNSSLMLNMLYGNAGYSGLFYRSSLFNSSLYLTQYLQNKTWMLRLAVEDIFKTYDVNHWRNTLPGAEIRMKSDANTRALMLTVRYSWGNLKTKIRSHSSIDEEASRI